MIVPDEAVENIVQGIMRVNKTGKRGDGKIFVSPIESAIRIRTGEEDEKAVS